jgi:hypothetical protein
VVPVPGQRVDGGVPGHEGLVRDAAEDGERVPGEAAGCVEVDEGVGDDGVRRREAGLGSERVQLAALQERGEEGRRGERGSGPGSGGGAGGGGGCVGAPRRSGRERGCGRGERWHYRGGGEERMMATGAGGVCRERFLDSVGEDMVALSSCERQRAQWRGRHISTGPQITGRHGLDRQPGLPHRVTGPMNRVHGLAPDRSKLLQKKKRQIQATRIRSPWIRSAIQIWDPEPHPFGFPFQPLKVGIPMWSHSTPCGLLCHIPRAPHCRTCQEFNSAYLPAIPDSPSLQPMQHRNMTISGTCEAIDDVHANASTVTLHMARSCLPMQPTMNHPNRFEKQ